MMILEQMVEDLKIVDIGCNFFKTVHSGSVFIKEYFFGGAYSSDCMGDVLRVALL